MYRRGQYYRKKRYFPLFPQETLAVVTAVVLGGAALIGFINKSGGVEGIASAYRNRNISLRQKLKQRHVAQQPLAEATPQAVTGNATGDTNTVKNMLDLNDPGKKDIAMQLVSSAENSLLNWRAQYGYIEDIGDGRGYTGGLIGFCSGTGDMLELVQYYTSIKPGNPLAGFLPALRAVNGSASHAGLGDTFVAAWKKAATDPAFQQAQDHERDRSYFDPAVAQAKADGLGALGQFIYYDAMVMHGPGNQADSFGGLRNSVAAKVKTPAKGGDQKAYLNAFLDAREALMRTESAHEDTTRVSTAQRAFLQAGNLNLDPPLNWKVYGDSYSIPAK